jgi:DNA-binding CsgD family transcriptional regulator
MAEGNDRNGCRMDSNASNEDSPNPQHRQQSLIETLIDLDSAYERDRVELERSAFDVDSKERLLRRLRERHRQTRQTYLQKLAAPQESSHPQAKRSADEPPTPTLSPQETDILRLVMAGAQTNEVAAQLSLERLAFKEHIRSILSKIRRRNPPLRLVSKADDEV